MLLPAMVAWPLKAMPLERETAVLACRVPLVRVTVPVPSAWLAVPMTSVPLAPRLL